jgi:selenocysteine lyase/cysteine desulfurase
MYKKFFSFFERYSEYSYFDTAATGLKLKDTCNNLGQAYEQYSFSLEKSHSLPTHLLEDALCSTTSDIQKLLSAEQYKVIYSFSITLLLADLVSFFSTLAKKRKKKLVILIPHTAHLSIFNPLFAYGKFFIIREYIYDGSESVIAYFNNADILYVPVVDHILGTLLREDILVAFKKINPSGCIIGDAAQSMRLHKPNLSSAVYDVFLFSSHKIYGAEGVAVGLFHSDFLAKLFFALELSWYNFKELSSHGSLPYASIFLINYSLSFLKNTVYVDHSLKNTLTQGVRYLFDSWRDTTQIKIISNPAAIDIVTFVVSDRDLMNNLIDFFEEKKIILRTGQLCSLFKPVSPEDTLMRISFGCYTSYSDIETLTNLICATVIE